MPSLLLQQLVDVLHAATSLRRKTPPAAARRKRRWRKRPVLDLRETAGCPRPRGREQTRGAMARELGATRAIFISPFRRQRRVGIERERGEPRRSPHGELADLGRIVAAARQ